jgi:hypothetical protein
MSTKLIVPTSINIVTLVNDTILKNYREGSSAEVVLPSLRQRAKMIVQEQGAIAVHEEEIAGTVMVTR